MTVIAPKDRTTRNVTDNMLLRRADVLVTLQQPTDTSDPDYAAALRSAYHNTQGDWNSLDAVRQEIKRRNLDYTEPLPGDGLAEFASKPWWQ